MKRISSLFESLLSAIAAIALVAMTLHIVTHALSRYLFQAPIYGTNELVTYWYLPVTTLVGFVVAMMRNEHISVKLILQRLKRVNQIEFTIFSDMVGILLCVGFSWYGLLAAIDNMAIGLTAGVTSIATWPVTFLVPIVYACIGVLFVIDIVTALRGRKTINEASSNGNSVKRVVG